jgi:hypothetical protein
VTTKKMTKRNAMDGCPPAPMKMRAAYGILEQYRAPVRGHTRFWSQDRKRNCAQSAYRNPRMDRKWPKKNVFDHALTDRRRS